MKKLIILFMLICSLFGVFALNSVNGSMVINGYYETAESEISFKVWEGNSNLDSERVYHSGDVTVGNPVAEEVVIFNWCLESTSAISVNLSFNITPLQAFSNGTYYIPKHTVAMYEGQVRQEHAFTTKSTGSSSYPDYRQSTSGAGSFIINTAVFSYSENLVANQPKTGYCTLQVIDYEENSAGNFDYVSYVTVEFGTP